MKLWFWFEDRTDGWWTSRFHRGCQAAYLGEVLTRIADHPVKAHRGVAPVESRRQRSTQARIKKEAKAESSISALSLPNIAHFLDDYGEITIGPHSEVGCVATARDEDIAYATIVRRRGESLVQFLVRLDRALDQALTLGIFRDQTQH